MPWAIPQTSPNRFQAKFSWHPIIDLMVERYAREQEDARRRDRLARSESSPPGDALLAELNAELNGRGSTRTTITDLPAELLGFDFQGWITLIAGLLLALTTSFTASDVPTCSGAQTSL